MVREPNTLPSPRSYKRKFNGFCDWWLELGDAGLITAALNDPDNPEVTERLVTTLRQRYRHYCALERGGVDVSLCKAAVLKWLACELWLLKRQMGFKYG